MLTTLSDHRKLLTMKVNPTEIARQMRKNGEDLRATGEEWVRLGEQQIKLADKFEGSLIMMNQLVAASTDSRATSLQTNAQTDD
jgi:hypothetical protein